MGHIARSVSIYVTLESLSKFSHPDVLMETFYRQKYEDIRVRTTNSTIKLYEILYDQFESNVWLEYKAL